MESTKYGWGVDWQTKLSERDRDIRLSESEIQVKRFLPPNSPFTDYGLVKQIFGDNIVCLLTQICLYYCINTIFPYQNTNVLVQNFRMLLPQYNAENVGSCGPLGREKNSISYAAVVAGNGGIPVNRFVSWQKHILSLQ